MDKPSVESTNVTREKDRRREEAKERLAKLASQPDAILSADPRDLLKLAKHVAEMELFRYARQLVAWARLAPVPDDHLRRTLGQKHALYTYKDPDLPVESRLSRALEILGETVDLAATTDPETLGIAGAIHKRMWDVDGQRRHLELAFSYYRRGFDLAQQSYPADQGYTAINAAFLLDLLAADEAQGSRAAGGAKAAEALRAQADEIRRWIVARLAATTSDDWWHVVTLAEAEFGLGNFDAAARAFRLAAQLKTGLQQWQYESTARQLAAVLRLRHAKAGSDAASSRAWACLKELIGDDEAGIRSAVTGKVGLALSGGGFRASFFHVGVLAWLAERGALSSVEVLSCVSGGSILGAHYYLMLRRLLESKTDGEVTPQDYVALVVELEREFLAGVQRNVRTRALAELWTSLRMIFQPHYTRTRRLGELYEKLLFSRVKDGGEGEKRWLSKLYINPPHQQEFNPRRDNWARYAKVPILVLNATTLNTGHNWQFTASWMGEPPIAVDEEVDANDRLRRMYYDEAPGSYKRVRLGHAVAASSCVPGLFEPFALPKLYPDRTVSLVDGGVHDNQGVAGLLEQDCTVLLVSDASGQMQSQAAPRGDPPGVLKRSNDVLMSRVRGVQYRELVARRRSSLIRALMFVHLKKHLDVTPVDWLGSTDPIDPDDPRTREHRGPVTPYGIAKGVQGLLAEIRTDLDSFSETEACALMLSGYRMAAHEFEDCVADFPPPRTSVTAPRWRFLRLQAPMSEAPPPPTMEAASEPTTTQRESDAARRLTKVLRVSRNQFFKVWRLPSVGLLATAVALAFVVVGILGMVIREMGLDYSEALVKGAAWVGSILGSVLLAVAVWGAVRVVAFGEAVSRVATGALLGLMGVVLWPINRLHLHLFDRFYLRQGRIDRVVGSDSGGVTAGALPTARRAEGSGAATS